MYRFFLNKQQIAQEKPNKAYYITSTRSCFLEGLHIVTPSDAIKNPLKSVYRFLVIAIFFPEAEKICA